MTYFQSVFMWINAVFLKVFVFAYWLLSRTATTYFLILFFDLAFIFLIYRLFLSKKYKKRAKGALLIRVGFWLVEGVLVAYLGWMIIVQFPGLFFV